MDSTLAEQVGVLARSHQTMIWARRRQANVLRAPPCGISTAPGMAMLIAAVTGGLLVATTGVARLTQLPVRAHPTRAVPR